MAWDFETDPELAAKMAWAREFVDNEVVPLEGLPKAIQNDRDKIDEITAPLKEQVREQGLWATHLPPDLGGKGFGQVALGLQNEILGRTTFAPRIFGVNAPDTGNAELLALGATEEQKEQWMRPLLDGQLRSAFSMTEPHTPGSDPTQLKTTAVRDGDEWVINGRKWFTSNGSSADFLLSMVVTNPEVEALHRTSMFIVPTDTPGLRIVRDVPVMSEPDHETGEPGGHSEVIYEDVRVPHANLVGGDDGVGQGFVLAQKRLGPGRIHHAMRWLGQSRRAFDMLCERALSREAHGGKLAEKQMVQDWIAESEAEMRAARLLTLQAAWHMDKFGASQSRTEIAIIKFWGAKVLFNVIDRAIQVHGALGVSTDLPLEHMYRAARAARIYDGPDEVHKVTVARRLLKSYEAVADLPTEHIANRRAAAEKKFGDYLERWAANDPM
ncbi:MAG: acyl-CoA dehydrogenase family protein [Actinomycetota bacterium]|nr:acyl-CoA dehydrogenase family protein [Actinomycetota bacterium]